MICPATARLRHARRYTSRSWLGMRWRDFHRGHPLWRWRAATAEVVAKMVDPTVVEEQSHGEVRRDRRGGARSCQAIASERRGEKMSILIDVDRT